MKFTFNHNNFNVLDLDRSISFYEKALGLKPVREKVADDGSFKLVYLSDGVTGHTLNSPGCATEKNRIIWEKMNSIWLLPWRIWKPPTRSIRKWAASVMKIPPWAFILFPIRIIIGLKLFRRNRMNPVFQRTARIIGEDGVELLSRKTAAVFGLGGVGSYAAEALVRAGVGHLIFIDKDSVDISNVNRQLVADASTLGRLKADVMAERALRVNPDCDVQVLPVYYSPGDRSFIENLHADFIIDAIDDVPAKISIVCECDRLHIPVISSMGTGNRLRPEMLEITDIYKTSVCHLARKIRKILKEKKIRHLPVVYSKEVPCKIVGEDHVPGSVSFVPPVSGMMMAGYVVRKLLEEHMPKQG